MVPLVPLRRLVLAAALLWLSAPPSTPRAAAVSAARAPVPVRAAPAPFPAGHEGERGRVALTVEVGPDGALGRVVRAAGEPAFVEAAERAARRFTVEPARDGDRPVAGVIDLGFDFRDPVTVRAVFAEPLADFGPRLVEQLRHAMAALPLPTAAGLLLFSEPVEARGDRAVAVFAVRYGEAPIGTWVTVNARLLHTVQGTSCWRFDALPGEADRLVDALGERIGRPFERGYLAAYGTTFIPSGEPEPIGPGGPGDWNPYGVLQVVRAFEARRPGEPRASISDFSITKMEPPYVAPAGAPAPATPAPGAAAPVTTAPVTTAPTAPGITAPALLAKLKPVPAPISRPAPEGVFPVRVAVDPDGAVVLALPLRAEHEEIERLAVEAACRQRFTPARRAGEAVPSWTTLELTFRKR